MIVIRKTTGGGATNPASTVVQVASPSLLIVPLGHKEQRLAPAPEYRPAEHAVSVDAPAAATMNPARPHASRLAVICGVAPSFAETADRRTRAAVGTRGAWRRLGSACPVDEQAGV